MYEFLKYTVADAMTSPAITVTPDTSLRELQELFEHHDFNGVPVVDRAGRLLGLATKFDVLKAFTFNPGNLTPHYNAIMAQPVKSVVSTEPVTVSADLPLSRLLQKLVEMGVKSLPVVADGNLIGIISREDVLRALRRATSGELPHQEVP